MVFTHVYKDIPLTEFVCLMHGQFGSTLGFVKVIDDAATAFAYYDSGADLFCKHWGQAEQALQAAWPLPLLSHWPRLLPA